MSEDIEVLKHKAIHKGELCFEGLYIDKRKRIVVRKKMKLTWHIQNLKFYCCWLKMPE